MRTSITQEQIGFVPITLSITCDSQDEYDYLTLLMSLTYDDVSKIMGDRIILGQTLDAPLPFPENVHPGEVLTAIKVHKGN